MKSVQVRHIRLLLNILFLISPWVAVSVLYAAPVRIGNVVPGVGVITKDIVSMREARYLDVVQQQTDFSCGAAAVGTIMRYAYGWNISETEVVRGLLSVSDPVVARERGFSLLDIKRYVEFFGMRGRGYRVGVQDLLRIRIPTIVLLDIGGYKHFVVLKETTAQHAYIADPALGNRRMALQEFGAAWNGIVFAVIGKDFERDSVLLDRKAPPTVRRSAGRIPLTDAELYEFGFTHGDLF